MILALDLGTNTGWAVKTERGIEGGTMSFASKRLEGAGMRYLRFERWLEGFTVPIKEIYFEEVKRHAGTQAAHVYGGFSATLMAWCEKNNVPYSSIPVGTIKRSATGKGNASKQQMIDAAIALGFNPVDDNHADAIHILRCAVNG